MKIEKQFQYMENIMEEVVSTQFIFSFFIFYSGLSLYKETRRKRERRRERKDLDYPLTKYLPLYTTISNEKTSEKKTVS